MASKLWFRRPMTRARLRCWQRKSNVPNANAHRALIERQLSLPISMPEINVVEVRVCGQSAGAVAPLAGKPGFYEFQYAPLFVNSGLELSPLKMKLNSRQRFSFPGLAPQTFHGLPGLLADALPDAFGNGLIDE